MDEPKVYAIILNWNLKKDTAEAVRSLLRSDYLNVRVLVLDNGSADGSVEFLGDMFPDLEAIALAENLGYAAGNNVGIRYALKRGAQYVLLLNNDAVVDADCLKQMVSCAAMDPRIGILAPVIYYYSQPERIWQCGARDRSFLPLPVDLKPSDLHPGNTASSAKVCEVDYVTGCAMLVRREVFEEVGMFDERFFMYYEDSDLCLRAKKCGYKVVAVLGAKVWHKVALSTKRDLPSQRHMKSRSRMLFYMRHNQGIKRIPVLAFLAGSVLLRLTSDIARGQLHLIKPNLLGIADGLKMSCCSESVGADLGRG